MTDEVVVPEDGPVLEGQPEAAPEEPGGPVLAVFAHPDDAEISAGGVLAKWAAAGRVVHLLILTNGDRGSQDPQQDRAELARTRAAESEDAASVMGLAGVEILSTSDGELDNTRGIQAEVARRIRTLKPVILVSCDPTAWFFGNRYFNHSDHRMAGAVALDAAFPGAGNPHFFVDQLADGLEPWNVPDFWLAWSNDPNHHEDVTGFMDAKLESLRRHASQVEGDMLGFFEQWLPMEAAENGRKIGTEHAEAFRVLNLG